MPVRTIATAFPDTLIGPIDAMDSTDSRWVKTTANELNNLLQVIMQSARFLEQTFGDHHEAEKYFSILRSSLDRATQVTSVMIEKAKNESGPGSLPPSATTQSLRPEPSKPAVAPVRPSAPSEFAIANPNVPGELILIVDDEAFVTLLAQRVLTDSGYRTLTAKDGFEALDIYKKMQDSIDLVILDFTMPIMDGSEVFDEMRMLNPRAPVVLSSGFGEQDKLKGMLAKGLCGFIPKPYSQQKLLLQVRSTLDALKSERLRQSA